MSLKQLLLGLIPALFLCSVLHAQPDRWQQRARYEMEIDFNVENHQFAGKQRLTYYNNSPDTLDRVFYHLYFNAFQPNSMMDVRSRTIPDPDRRVGDRISQLKPNEMGYQRISSLTQDGKPVRHETVGTVLEVDLAQPIMPGDSALFVMDFTAQVPLQIRRSGRESAEGIAYSMAQWYPKMAEYDYQGWHANPYIAREFYGIWGDFEVKITIDKDYVIGGTGYLQNPEQIGHGYTDQPVNHRGEKITYHFVAPEVHDFVWAADPDYKHVRRTRKDGMVMHFFYLENEETQAWAQLPEIMDRAFDFINANYGQYPYKQYSFIQGGDGGMEYPMATLITGERPLESLVGVSIHELMHSWYQMILGTNESLYAWMDEGFTEFASNEITDFLIRAGLPLGEPSDNPHEGSYASWRGFLSLGIEEPMATHADHFMTNTAYGQAAYTKGALFLEQLRYIIGDQAFRRGMHRYFDTWKFRHPNPNDFIRIMEKESGLELDWYKEYMVYTTATTDYAVAGLEAVPGADSTSVQLEKPGRMPMPLDVLVELEDGSRQWYHIPLVIMRGAKPAPAGEQNYTVLPDWAWVMPRYSFTLPYSRERIRGIVIDPRGQMFDTDPANNRWPRQEEGQR